MAAAAPLAGAPADAAPRPLLPNLVQEAPYGLVVTASPEGPLLGFASAVANRGAGPLIVQARRHRRGAPAMAADQIVLRRGAGPLRRRGAGRLRYVSSPDHSHWHLSPFETYVLRRAGGGRRVVRSGKQGFCLGDRYPAVRTPPAPPRYVGRCGLGSPGLLRLRQGISVGYGDDYPATLEGQHVPLAGLPAGRYVLVHRVNGGRRLLESDHSDNAASALVRLTWRGGRASVRTLRTCPGRAACRLPARA